MIRHWHKRCEIGMPNFESVNPATTSTMAPTGERITALTVPTASMARVVWSSSDDDALAVRFYSTENVTWIYASATKGQPTWIWSMTIFADVGRSIRTPAKYEMDMCDPTVKFYPPLNAVELSRLGANLAQPKENRNWTSGLQWKVRESISL